MHNRIWLVFLLCLATFAQADSRTKNLDFIILLDKSLSMVDKIGDVKTFFKTQILEKSAIPGDEVIVIQFYGKAELLIQKTIRGSSEVRAIEQVIDSVKPDGRYTDIGNALDFTYDFVQKLPQTEHRRHFVLLTDGRQEAPPGSKYQSTDFSVRHHFLESAKNIQKEGWKVQVLGIGTDTEAQNLADELSGVSKIWEKTQSMLLDRQWNAEEELRLKSPPSLVFEGGNPELQLDLDLSDVKESKNFEIRQILAIVPHETFPIPLLESPFKTILKTDSSRIIIPLQRIINPITLEKATFVLQYGGDLPLTPGRFSAPSGWFFLQDGWQQWAFVVLALTALLGFLVVKGLALFVNQKNLQRKTVEFSRTSAFSQKQ